MQECDEDSPPGLACAIVQARMCSERLPGKTLLELAGKPVLAHVIDRLKACKTLDCVAVATSRNPADDAIVSLCNRLSVRCERGSEDDVLKRYISAASAIGADIVVRVTGDNPLVDPDIVDCLVDAMRRDPDLQFCYAANSPLGTSCEAVSLAALRHVQEICDRPDHREHVTLFIREHPDRFRLKELRSELGRPDVRLTLDTHEDFQVLSAVFHELYRPGQLLAVQDVIDYLSSHEDVVRVNKQVQQRRPGSPVV